MDFGSHPEVSEEQVDPEDSSLFKDTRVPLTFKNEIMLELYNAEEEQIKTEVQSKHEYSPVKTIYNASSEEDQMVLV